MIGHNLLEAVNFFLTVKYEDSLFESNEAIKIAIRRADIYHLL